LRSVEETRNNPIPFLILATVVGLLLGSWWIGLLVGIGMTIIPGIALYRAVHQQPAAPHHRRRAHTAYPRHRM
jgi:hypothetical protein